LGSTEQNDYESYLGTLKNSRRKRYGEKRESKKTDQWDSKKRGRGKKRVPKLMI